MCLRKWVPSNPLTAISLNLEQVNNNDTDQISNAKSYLNQAIIATHKMEDLIISIKRQIQRKSNQANFLLNQEINQVIQILAYKARQANVEIIFISPQYINYYGEAVKFGQIVTNLICNAIESFTKSSPFKQVEVNLIQQANQIILTVSDTGCGIRPVDMAQIFQPFFSTKSANEQGLGLGLSSTKHIIEKDFHGSIQVTSQNKKTTFTIIFPIQSNAQKDDIK